MDDRQEKFSGTKDVQSHLKLDISRLTPWLKSNVEGFSGPLTVKEFKGGQSNPTYQLVTPDKRYVLRRKPPGILMHSAHAVDREFRVIDALGHANFAVPKAFALCEDDNVLGNHVLRNGNGRRSNLLGLIPSRANA